MVVVFLVAYGEGLDYECVLSRWSDEEVQLILLHLILMPHWPDKLADEFSDLLPLLAFNKVSKQPCLCCHCYY